MRGCKPPNDPGDLNDIGGKVRLFTDAVLCAGAPIAPGESQQHYLIHVMRVRQGDRVLLFNGRDGEWRATIADLTRRGCVLMCERQIRAQDRVPDLWLAFAPVKKMPAEFLTQKATELGVACLMPVLTERTVARRVNIDRMRANAIEAAEQSERLTVPDIQDPVALPALLQSWPERRRLLFCDEGGDAPPIGQTVLQLPPGEASGVLTGPEGGFAPHERELIRQHPAALPVSLGPRIMRADTAALAALAIWQAIRGDWSIRLVTHGAGL